MRGEYIATRSARRPGDTDIDSAWADEAYTDEARVVFDPDYASKTGRSVRTIGYSPTAGFIITVITVVEEGHLWGVNAWKANEKDAAAYEGSQ